MKKIGLIPPHFLYFLENEGIDLVDFRSRNFYSKDSYDRLIVKLPYGIDTLDIQVIFDTTNLSSPPDFVILNGNETFMDYNEIIKQWNFRESNSLYLILKKIKDNYGLEQENKLYDIIKNLKNRQQLAEINANSKNTKSKNIYTIIEEIIKKIKNSFENYKELPKSSRFCDINFKYVENKENLVNENIYNLYEKGKGYLTEIQISFTLDCLIRSREINRSPILTILIPINNSNLFNIKITLPHFVAKDTFNVSLNNYNLQDYNKNIDSISNKIIKHFQLMQKRETVICKIIDSNIGFPIEIDSFNFTKLILYFHYSKNISNNYSENKDYKSTTSKKISNATTGYNCNFLIYIIFDKDERSNLEFQVVDNDKLRIVQRKKVDYGTSEREINNILHLIVSAISECIQQKEKLLNK